MLQNRRLYKPYAIRKRITFFTFAQLSQCFLFALEYKHSSFILHLALCCSFFFSSALLAIFHSFNFAFSRCYHSHTCICTSFVYCFPDSLLKHRTYHWLVFFSFFEINQYCLRGNCLASCMYSTKHTHTHIHRVSRFHFIVSHTKHLVTKSSKIISISLHENMPHIWHFSTACFAYRTTIKFTILFLDDFWYSRNSKIASFLLPSFAFNE